MSGTTLITKYRPELFEEVVGHTDTLKALQRAVNQETTYPHCFLFTGAGGLGKTSLARIVGKHFDCELLEIDAASNNGVDAMRDLVEIANHMSLSGNGRRMIVIDEAHTLSKQGWDVLLKITEEPPEHLFISLCTTAPAKVPDTIQQRCYKVSLKPIGSQDIDELLGDIAQMEGWAVQPEVRQAVVEVCGGSPRKAISIFEQVWGCKDRDEVRRIVDLVDADNVVIQICQLLMKQDKNWVNYQRLVIKMDDEAFGSAVAITSSYICKAMVGAKEQSVAVRNWHLLQALTFPTDSFDPKARYLTILGRMLQWQE